MTEIRRVLITYTGGTIGMQKTQRGFAPAPGQLAKELYSMPQFQDPSQAQGITSPSRFGARVQYEIVEDDPLVDSSNMQIEDWVRIARTIEDNYANYDGFVVLHGTDTMAYTASALSFMLVNLSKTVVLTGSQIPLSASRNDAIDNLLSSLTIAAHYQIPEVCVYFHHQLLRGNRTQKVDASGFKAFESGNLPPLATVGTEIAVNWTLVRQRTTAPLKVRTITESNVACLRLFPGITVSILENFLRPPLRGVVIETYGAGNAPDNREDLLQVLREANARGVVMVNCTQCQRGSVRVDYAAGTALAEVGVVSGIDMTVEAALTKLAYLLSQPDLSPDVAKRLMGTSLRGELKETAGVGPITLHERIFAETVAQVLGHPGKSNVEPEIADALFPTLMCAAAHRGDIDALQRLQSIGVSVNVSDYDGRTPLHLAAAEGQGKTTAYLLEQGANVHAKDRWGYTPLEDANRSGHKHIVQQFATVKN